VLVKKNEGRPVTPEEYQLLSRFVTRVETGAVDRRQAELDAQMAVQAEIRERIPESAFDIPLDELGISPRTTILLTGEGYSTIGELMMQLEIDEDQVLALNGVGPKAMEDIHAALEGFDFPVVEKPEPEVAEEAPKAEAEMEVEAEAAEGEPVAEAETAEAEAQPEAVADVAVEEAQGSFEEAQADEEPEEELTFEEALAREEAALAEEEEKLLKLAEESEKKKKEDKKKYRQVEFDPDLGVEIVRRRRKGEEDEDWDKYLD
jgi:N utilization substance protein A